MNTWNKDYPVLKQEYSFDTMACTKHWISRDTIITWSRNTLIRGKQRKKKIKTKAGYEDCQSLSEGRGSWVVLMKQHNLYQQIFIMRLNETSSRFTTFPCREKISPKTRSKGTKNQFLSKRDNVIFRRLKITWWNFTFKPEWRRSIRSQSETLNSSRGSNLSLVLSNWFLMPRFELDVISG